MSTIYYKGLCHVEVKLKNQDLLSSMCVQLQQLCLGQVVTIVLGQVVTTVTMLKRLVPMVQPMSCVLTMNETKTYLTTTCESFISLAKLSVPVYNQYCKC